MSRNLQAHWLTYDIPQRSGIRNPSRFLRRRAFRPNKSVWVVCKADIPYNLIAEMKEKGASVYCIEFAAHENDNLVALAIASVKRDIMEKIAATRRIVAQAQRREREAMDNVELSGDERRELVDSLRARARTQIRSARALMKDLRECCERFGVSESAVDLGGALGAVNAIQETIAVRARAVRKAVAKIKETRQGSQDDAIMAALMSDAMPQDIAADYLEDTGRDASELREAFGK